MKAPRHIAAIVCLFCVFSAFQSVAWHYWHHEAGWRPSWWQSHALAWFGDFILQLAVMPLVFFQRLDIYNDAVHWVAVVFGVAIVFTLIYLVAFGFATLLFRSLHGFRNHTKVA
jgi:hypothetical protein